MATQTLAEAAKLINDEIVAGAMHFGKLHAVQSWFGLFKVAL